MSTFMEKYFFVEARIGFTKELFEVNEKSGVANIGLIFQSGEVNVPVTVRLDKFL